MYLIWIYRRKNRKNKQKKNRKNILDFWEEPCYLIIVRKNEAEFHSHLSAFRRLGFILQI